MNTYSLTSIHTQENLIAKLQVLQQKRNSLYPHQAALLKLQRLLDTLRHMGDYPELAAQAEALFSQAQLQTAEIRALITRFKTLNFTQSSARHTQKRLIQELEQVVQTLEMPHFLEDMQAVRRIARTIHDNLVQQKIQSPIIEEAYLLENGSDQMFYIHLENLIALIHESISRRLLASEPILLVEDDWQTAQLVHKHLESQGFSVEQAGNAAMFYQKIQERPFSLILLDVSLPDADGRNLLVEFKQKPEQAHIPVMIMSGRGSAIRAECLALGADQVFDKPLDLHALTAAVSERLKTKRMMESQAFLDPLTGLPNRASLFQTYRRYLALAQRNNKPLSIAILDIDHFKAINDTWGHPAGDKALRDLSTLLAENLRKADVVARWGGEEFVLLLLDTPLDSAWHVLDNLRRKVAQTTFITPDQHTFSLHFSAGVANVRLKSTLEESVARADHALYLAKQSGRNQVIAQPEYGFAPEPSIHLFIIDDDALVLSVLSNYFQSPPFVLSPYTQGLPTLDELLEKPPHLLLIDADRLAEEEFSWLKALRQSPYFQILPILILASHGQQDMIDQGLKQGADDFILKPFTPAELQARILHLLQNRHTANSSL